MATGIYKISNTIDNKIYIGSAYNFKDRWASHRYELLNEKHPNTILQNFVCKYGIACLVFEIVEKCDSQFLLEREQFYLDTLKPEFNISKFASSFFKGMKHSEEAKDKIRKKNSGRKFTEEHRQKISKGHKGKVVSEETRKKLSIVKKGTVASEETKRKISKGCKGKIVSWETREKMRIRSTGRKHTEQSKRKISRSQKGKIISEENKQKTRERMLGNTLTLGYKQTEETKKKMSEVGKGKHKSEEHKQKIRMALLGRKRPKEVVDKIVAVRKENNSYKGNTLGYKQSETTCRAISSSKKGKKISEEHKQKISEAFRKRRMNIPHKS